MLKLNITGLLSLLFFSFFAEFVSAESAKILFQPQWVAQAQFAGYYIALDKGFYVMPTVFGDVKQHMKIAREEIFGPVASVLKFSSDEEVIEQANDSIFGLCASLWTKDTAKGIRMVNQIQAGSVWVNSTPGPSPDLPWGGFKESGIGKEYSIIGFEDVTQMKVIGVNLA